MFRSQAERLWILGGLVAGLLMLLIGYTMFISPQNSSTSSARSEVSAAQLQNLKLQARIGVLRSEYTQLPKYQSDVRIAQLALPSTSGLPDFLRTLQSIGSSTATNVSALTVGAPTDVSTVAASLPAASAGASSAGSVGRVFAIPITAQVSGTTSQLDQFLTQLQSVQPRAVLISQLVEGDGTSSAQGSSGTIRAGSSLQLTMQAFVAPANPAEKAQLQAAAGK
jgi:Tfp pilus assembly protein PilO